MKFPNFFLFLWVTFALLHFSAVKKGNSIDERNKKTVNIMPVRSRHRWQQNLSFQCCQKFGTLEMKGIKNREHHACPVMLPLAAKSSISVLT
jgi:hypothetical protein